ncbi:MAG: bifunctional aldolase/short-chain dehydrogenase [Georgenia sp.]
MAGALSPEGRELLAQLVVASRTLGSDPQFVLHGGGNTSVKTTWHDVTGRDVPVLLVKGSGHDLAGVGPEGFAPLRLERLRELLPPTRLPAADLADELAAATLDPSAPAASVETLVHALLPHTAVLHSHADAVLALTNTPNGRELIGETFGEKVVVVDYAMPGPLGAAACLAAWQAAADRHDRAWGLVILNHGLFTVGETPQQALDRHVSLVELARQRVRGTGSGTPDETVEPHAVEPADIARLRRRISEQAGRPLVVRRAYDDQVANFLASDGLLEAASRGPITPDHVIFTGRTPLVGTDVDAYAAGYRAYFDEHAYRAGAGPHDPAPRVVLDAELGLLTAGRNAREAQAAQDICRHTMDVIAAAERLGGYRPAGAEHVFDLEHWPAQVEKLARTDDGKPLAGRVAVVTGAASGIGRACAEELLASGASVVGWDVSPSVATTFATPEWLGLQVDVTSTEAQRAALAAGVEAFGGLDILVVSAGIFPTAQHLAEMEMSMWRRTMGINVDAVAELYGMAHPLLAQAPGGGRVVVVASKNVKAPGPGAAAYSASKAALVQLSRVAALEWAPDGIRVNMVHPDAVFDTALWTPELLAKRAEHYGMSVEQYKRRNLMHTEVTSAAVARMVRSMADETFAATTGAQVPVDGGNERVI